METSVLKYIRENGLAEVGSRIGIAVSGGPDSMALLYCFNELRKRNYFDICALHMEHGIRGKNSVADAEFVKEQCGMLNIPLYMEYADIPSEAKKGKLSIETAAKKAREKFFENVIKARYADYIATAHHASDNAESVLMHMLRGSGLTGLKGIRAKRGYLIRPLLTRSRDDIIKYLEKRQIPYRIDETNNDNSYTRNFIRNVLIKEADGIYGNVTDAINRLSCMVRTDADYIDGESEKAFSECVMIKKTCAEIDLSKLNAYHKAISSRVLIKALKEMGMNYDIEEKHIDALLKIAQTRETGKRTDLINGFGGFIEYGKLIIVKRAEKVHKHTDNDKYAVSANIPGITRLPNGDIAESEIVASYLKNNDDKYTECFDFDKLPRECFFKSKGFSQTQTAERIYPLGAPGGKKLGRYFTDKKVPEKLRSKIPLLTDNENVIWAVGYTISELYKVDENTKTIVKIKYLRKE